ncbi:MAG: 50S ribosomal protein L25 [Parcubacteria group bacterium]|jgi:large subunit ribosomal protein L25
MEKITLKAKKREQTGKKMRAEAGTNIPAVVYGDGVKAQSIWIDSVEFARVFAQAGMSTVVTLEIDGEKKPVNVLIYDYQNNPVSGVLTHIDLYVLNMKEEVETGVSLVFVGIAPAVKELGGTLVKTLDELEVRALPADLPHEIEVNLETLKTFDDHITVGDLTLGDKVHILADPETIIAMVSEPRSEEELASLNTEVDADVSKIEGVADKVVEEEKKEK